MEEKNIKNKCLCKARRALRLPRLSESGISKPTGDCNGRKRDANIYLSSSTVHCSTYFISSKGRANMNISCVAKIN